MGSVYNIESYANRVSNLDIIRSIMHFFFYTVMMRNKYILCSYFLVVGDAAIESMIDLNAFQG